jgi:hypothetical protein
MQRHRATLDKKRLGLGREALGFVCGRDHERSALFIGRREAGERWRSLTLARRARRDETLHCASAGTATSLRANYFRREVGDG